MHLGGERWGARKTVPRLYTWVERDREQGKHYLYYTPGWREMGNKENST